MKTFLRVKWILVLAACVSLEPARAADVSYYGIIKSQYYVQPTNGSPAALPSNGFAFTAFVYASSNHVVLAATVKPPGSTPLRTLESDASQIFWQFDHRTNSSAALDAVYPTGNPLSPYTFNLQTTNDGLKSATLSFFLIGTPPVPQITNLPAAQNINSAADFTLQWASLGGSALDILQLTIVDGTSNVVFATPAPFQSNALNGASTSVVLPAHSLPPGAMLTGFLNIGRPGLPNTSYATGLAALAKITSFPLRTRPLAPPRLSVLSRPGQPFQFRVTGESNVNYEILASSNLTNWILLLTTNATGGVIDFTDPRSPGLDRSFYRSRAVP